MMKRDGVMWMVGHVLKNIYYQRWTENLQKFESHTH